MKKTLSLFLALILVLSVFALPAAAATGDAKCPTCSGTNMEYYNSGTYEAATIHVDSCDLVDGYHPHYRIAHYDRYYCYDCEAYVRIVRYYTESCISD